MRFSWTLVSTGRLDSGEKFTVSLRKADGEPFDDPITPERLMASFAKMKAALERIKAGTHEEHPTCMTCPDGSFGPPRTGGWEGWAREIDALHKRIATEALE